MKAIARILLILFPSFLFGQRASEILNQKLIFQPKYTSSNFMCQKLKINLGFGSSQVDNTSELKGIDASQVIRIDLVYTDFPVGQDLSNLNKKRIDNLFSLNSSLINNQIEWNIIAQSDFINEEEAKEFFHGFVIYYRPKQSAKLVEDEIKYLDSLFDGKSIPIASRAAILERVWEFEGEKPIMVYEKSSSVKGEETTTSLWRFNNSLIKDSTILKVLERNSWGGMAIIADATGSMSPYTAQLLMWLQLQNNSKKVEQVTFFNDGDSKLDKNKIEGETGGIYSAKTSTYQEIKELLYHTMRLGGGGDSQENDIEAIMESMKICTTCDQLILVADNFANMRDIKLLKEIKKPVRIIVCGVYGGVNKQYLKLARDTGGSIHTIEEDIINLKDLNEGAVLEIGTQVYKIIGGEFIKISDL